jgi:electron-transferring-flavoprotein dehydrogenase
MRQVFDKGFFMGGALASAMTVTKGNLPPKEFTIEPNADRTLIRTDRAARYPAPDGKLTFDKLSSVFLSGNRTRDDQPNHLRIQRTVPKDLADAWVHMCPAQVYEAGAADGDGMVHVEVNPSNCVQCGAISAKDGRLTPPEGGSGPEYTITYSGLARPRPSRFAARPRGGSRRADTPTRAGPGRSVIGL